MNDRTAPDSKKTPLARPMLAAALAVLVSGGALAGETGKTDGGLDAKKSAVADNTGGSAAIPPPGSKIVLAKKADPAKAATYADNAPVSIDQIVIGDPSAPLTIIEYGSPTCGHCASFHNDVLPELKKDYIETGRAKLVFRPFMLNGADVYAGLLVACVAPERQPAMLDALYKTQQTWVPYGAKEDEFAQQLIANLRQIGNQAGLSNQKFDACMSNERNKAWLQEIMNVAQNEHTISSTPSFVIGGEVYRNMPYAEMQTAIARAEKTGGPEVKLADDRKSDAKRGWGEWFSGLFGL